MGNSSVLIHFSGNIGGTSVNTFYISNTFANASSHMSWLYLWSCVYYKDRLLALEVRKIIVWLIIKTTPNATQSRVETGLVLSLSCNTTLLYLMRHQPTVFKSRLYNMRYAVSVEVKAVRFSFSWRASSRNTISRFPTGTSWPSTGHVFINVSFSVWTDKKRSFHKKWMGLGILYWMLSSPDSLSLSFHLRKWAW